MNGGLTRLMATMSKLVRIITKLSRLKMGDILYANPIPPRKAPPNQANSTRVRGEPTLAAAHLVILTSISTQIVTLIPQGERLKRAIPITPNPRVPLTARFTERLGSSIVCLLQISRELGVGIVSQ